MSELSASQNDRQIQLVVGGLLDPFSAYHG